MNPSRAMLFACVIVALSSSAQAQIVATWDGSSGAWSNGARWSSNPLFPNNGNGGFNYNAVVNSGAVTLDQDVTINQLKMTGGSISGPSSGGPFALNISNLVVTGGGFGGPITINHSGTSDINNPGGLTFAVNSGATFNNLAGATFKMADSVSISGAGVINNYGTWHGYQGSGALDFIYPTFNNQAGGVVSVENQTSLRFFGGGTHDGSFSINTTNGGIEFNGHHVFNAGSSVTSVGTGGQYLIYGTADIYGNWAPSNRTWVFGSTAVTNFNMAYNAPGELVVENHGTANFNTATNVGGYVHVKASTLNANADLTLNNTDFEGGIIGGSATNAIVNAGSFRVISGASILQHDLSNTGTIDLNAGDLRLDGITLTNQAGANYNIHQTTPTYLSTGTFENYGTVTKVDGANEAIIEPLFNNHAGALVKVQAGNLTLSNPGTLDGTFDISTGASLRFSAGSLELSNIHFTGGGLVEIFGATASVSNPLALSGGLQLTSGTLKGNGAISGTTLVLSGGTIDRDLSVFGTVSNSISGSVQLTAGHTLTNGPGVTLTADTTAAAGSLNGAGTFVNQGTFNKTGLNAYTINTGFSNDGIVNVNQGSLRLAGAGTQTGVFNLAGGSVLNLAGASAFTSDSLIAGAGRLNVTGSGSSIVGDGDNSFSGGTRITSTGNLLITGSGTALGIGPVDITSGGVLRISDNGNLTAGSTLVEAGGTLAVEGNFNPTAAITAASAGTLGINSTSFTTALDMSTIGNGQMSLGSTTNGIYSAATLGAGSDNVYHLGGGGGTLTLAGANLLTGATNSVQVAGAGTVVLASSNNYAGGTTLASTGTLALGDGHALGSGVLTINGGTLQAVGNVSVTNSAAINGAFRFTGTDNLTIGNFLSSITLAGQERITVDSTGVLTLAGKISPAGTDYGLIKDGSGTLVLTNSNTYAGGTVINAGTVYANTTLQALGGGPVTIKEDAVLRQRALGNLGGAGIVEVQSGGILAIEGNFAPRVSDGLGAAPKSNGIIALDVANYTVALDQSKLGNTFLGSRTNAVYDAATLGAGSGSTYQLGGGGGTLTISHANVLTGSSFLVVGSTQHNGAGTLVLNADQDFLGTTLVNAGSTLVLNGNLTGGGQVTVLDGGTLKGSGSILSATDVSLGGTISPGNSPGMMTSEILVLREGSIFHWELGSLTEAGPGLNYDVLAVNGEVAIDPRAKLDLAFLTAGSAPDQGNAFWQDTHSWHIIDLADGATNPDGAFTLSIDNTPWLSAGAFHTELASDGGVNLVWEATAVPEPSTWMMLGLATIAGAIYRRRSAQKRIAGEAETTQAA